MNTCPNCNFQNPEELHICLRCAASLNLRCKNCGAELPADNRFCGQCGAEIQSNPYKPATVPSQLLEPTQHTNIFANLKRKMPANLATKIAQKSTEIVGQRKEVTVVFVEVSNYKQAAQTLDSEVMYLAIDEIVRLFADIIYKYEGTIDQFTGSGVVALFGIPLNHENDPERAVRAALEIQRLFPQIQTRFHEQYSFDFQINIGINTGTVIVGQFDIHNHLEYTVVGDTVRLAANLSDLCSPGTILASFSTFHRSRRVINYQRITSKTILNGEAPLECYQPLDLRLEPGQPRGLPGMQVPIVGRNDVFRLVKDAVKQVCSLNNSHVVLISGEAGIGKTRLIAECRNAFAGQPMRFFQGTCAAYMRITPYRVLTDIVRNLLGISELDPDYLQREAIRHRLELLGLDVSEIMPYLLQVLGLPQFDPIQGLHIKMLEPDMMQRQIHVALRLLFLGEAWQSPLTLVFDDLHWVDPASHQFLEYLCQSIDETPILFVLISRDFENFDSAREILTAVQKRSSKPLEIKLAPLSRADSVLLVDQLIQDNSLQAKQLKSIIVQRADGNPYYTEELVRVMIDHGAIVNYGGNWHVNALASQIVNQVPATLQDIILARFDLLPKEQQTMLQIAAVLGSSFGVGLYQQVIGSDDESLANGLQGLEEHDFLLRTQFGSEDGYSFKHSLVLDTIYATMLKKNLGRIHYQIAECIEGGEYWLPGERAEVLAHHYALSSKPSKAVPYLLSASKKAAKNYANEAVIYLSRKALEIMGDDPAFSSLMKGTVRLDLAIALKYTGQFSEALDQLNHIVDPEATNSSKLQNQDIDVILLVVDAMRELGDIRAREGRFDTAEDILSRSLALLGPRGRDEFPAQWRRLADRLAWVYFRQSRLDEAYNLADLVFLDHQSLELDDPITLASLYNTIGGIYWSRSRYPEAIETVQHSLEIYRNLNYQWGIAIAQTNLGVLCYSTEKWKKARHYMELADRLQSECGYDPERATNLKNLGEVLIDLGDFPNARTKLETSREISERLNMELTQIHAELGLVRLCLLENKTAEASMFLSNARRKLITNSGSNDLAVQVSMFEAQVENAHGNYFKALAAVRLAKELNATLGEIENELEILRILGMTHTNLKDYEQAESDLSKMVNLAKEHEIRIVQGRGLAELGYMYTAWYMEDPLLNSEFSRQAGKALDQAIQIFDDLGASNDLIHAQMVRAQVASPAASAKRLTGSLQMRSKETQVRERLGLPQGEWYQSIVLTILLSERQEIDEELVFESIHMVMPNLIEIIQDNGGQVQTKKNQLIAIFGIPGAHEDDPERAVETAMQVLNFYNMLYSQTLIPITIRLGVSMGKLVAGHIDSESINELVAAGEPLLESLDLAEACTPGRTWVTQAVRNATSFKYEFIPISTPISAQLPEIAVFELAGVREQILPIRGMIGLKTPFVGRQTELKKMNIISQSLASGSGGMIWVEGEAGIGKSRLMREFGHRVAPRGVQVWQGLCTTRTQDVAFSLFSDLLSMALDIQPNQTIEQIYKQIDLQLANWPAELTEIRPFLELLIGVQPGLESIESVLSLEPEQLRRQTFVALHRLIGRLAKDQPLLLILDDLQWIDSISADLLLYLSSLVVSCPVLFVCAKRSGELSTHEKTLQRVRSIHPEKHLHMLIQPLNLDERQQLLDEFLSAAILPESVRTLIIQQSGGNPYFIEEFVRMLVEQNYLRVTRDHLEVNQELVVDTLSVPSSLETLIRARVDSLPSSSRNLLQVASVLGIRFHENLLNQVAERSDSEADLLVLQSRGMLNLAKESGFVEFSHPMIESIVYNTVLRAHRKILHARAAETLEISWAGQEWEHAEVLAYHYEQAELYKKALDYMILAGERAATRHANEAAVNYFERASETLAVVSGASANLRWRMITGLGQVYQFIGKYEASLSVLHSGEDVIQHPELSTAQRAAIYRLQADTAFKGGDPDSALDFSQMALEILGQPVDTDSKAEAARIFARLGWSYFIQANLEQAEGAVLQSLQYGNQAGDLNAQAAAENLLGGIHWRQRDLPQALEHTRLAMAFWQEIGYSWGVAVTLSNLGILEILSGQWREAFESISKSLSMRQEMGDVEGVAINNLNLGFLSLDQGRFEAAESYFHSSLAISRPFRINFPAANSCLGLARCLIVQGRLEEVESVLQEGLLLANEINARDVLSELHRVQAEFYLARGELERVLEMARLAADIAQESGNDLLHASALRIAARSLLQQGHPTSAQETLQAAQQVLEQAPDELEAARIHALSAEVLKTLHEPSLAQEHLQVAREVFERLGAAYDLQKLI